jgi:glycosyltransferase involved in cell wall biosynthesis
MRIGFVTGEYPPLQGGVGAFTRELARALVVQGHDVYVLTDHTVPSSSGDHLHIVGSVVSWSRASLGPIRHWAQVNRLDVVNVQYEAAAFKMSPLIHFLPRLLAGIPIVTTFHDLLVPYLFPKAGPLRFRALLTLARHSSGVIVTNRQDERRLSAEQGTRALCNIPIGSNVSVNLPPDFDREAWRRQLNIPEGATLVGYFGFMNASKGVDTLLRGLELLVKGDFNVYGLLIGGRTGSSDPTNIAYAEVMDRLILSLGLQDRVRWTGFVEGADVSANLTACDMIALPYKDGVSLRRGTFMAAIVHGCAIITTEPDGELPEVEHDGNVYLIQRDDPDGLARAVQTLAGRPDLRRQLGANAQKLSQAFTWESIAARSAAFFAEIVGATAR